MFLNHFALTAHPFAKKPPIEWLLRDERTEQAWTQSFWPSARWIIRLTTNGHNLGQCSPILICIQNLLRRQITQLKRKIRHPHHT
jgi:hypothetical protein